MAANPLRPGLEKIDPNTESGWDAQRVWRERVSRGPATAPQAQQQPGWDPYLVWLSRVKKA